MTIQFIPMRLNATPVVFRGMTGKEVVLCAAIGLLSFLPIGLIGWAIVGMGAMVPTCMFLGAALFLWSGGTIMRRLRRGRPTSWIYRRLQWQLAKAGFPFVPGGHELIQKSIRWRIRRDSVRHSQVKPKRVGKRHSGSPS